MPARFLLSHLKAMPFDFKVEVESYVKRLMEHRFTIDEPAPLPSHEWIERAVKRVPGAEGHPDDFVPDYEIVDDTPSPPTLDEKKHHLVAQLHAVVNEKHAALMPPLKTRLWNHEFHRISTVLGAAVAKMEREGEESSEAHHARALATIEAKDAKFLAEHAVRLKGAEVLQYYIAKCESDIHDLTEQTIAAWRLPPFPGA